MSDNDEKSLRTRSKCSGSSSTLSSLSTVIAKKRAKAEAEREKLKFTKREAEMKRKKAELESEMKRKEAEFESELLVIEQEKIIAAAEAEFRVLQEENDLDAGWASANSNPVDDEIRHVPHGDELEQTNVSHGNELEQTKMQRTAEYCKYIQAQSTSNDHPLNANTEFEKRDIARFMLKKDLLLNSLTKFSDKPESYPSWRASFESVIKELYLTPCEEMDLLIRWLGPESAKQVASIKIACVSAPGQGLQRAWERLEERYGTPEMIESAVKNKLTNFPKLSNRDNKKLYDLLDILYEIEAIKHNPKYCALLAYYDASSGVLPIVQKLPYGLQEKWSTRAARYKADYDVSFPPFSVFVQFIRDMSKIKNDPSLTQFTAAAQADPAIIHKLNVNSKKTAVKTVIPEKENMKLCPLHNTGHSLNECRAFQTKPFEERKQILKQSKMCFKCCESDKHQYKNCTMHRPCDKCGSNTHATAMHLERVKQNGGERNGEHSRDVNSKCTQICGDTNFAGKSCAKLIQVTVFSQQNINVGVKAYAILDEQSNKTLAKSELFDKLELRTKEIEYCLSSCSGRVATSGRESGDFVIVSHDDSVTLNLPSVLECNNIPNMRDEIPTPDVARHHEHLKEIATSVPELDSDREILLLIGRDVAEAHHVQEQIIGPRGAPYAQRLPMGWVIVGEACLGNVHQPKVINVNKTYVTQNERPTLFPPCTSRIDVKEKDPTLTEDNLFERSEDDDKVGWSVEDKRFIEMMKHGFEKSDGHWSAPLPFQKDRQRLPNNRAQALSRAKVLESTFKRNAKKQSQYVDFMSNIIEKGHAEVAPPLKNGEECWYLPHFGVFHPKKPEKIRVVFDSSAKFQDVSLNDILLSGPNLMNNLLGVLLRFRKEKVAIAADIEQMFYCFKVSEEHRNYLRFFWYENNDPAKRLIEYRMCVHVFGNKPSPSVATYGLRKTAENCADAFGPDVTHFVSRNFYVDDGLTSLPTNEALVDLMQRTQAGLQKEGSLRLHKIVSNKKEVMDSFPATDLANDLKDLDLASEDLPMQRSLGLLWNLEDDEFRFKMSSEEKAYTRRGVLSVVNSIYDPLGFVAPVTIQGKLLLRDLMTETKGWDDPLPPDRFEEWSSWKESLRGLEATKIPRAYVPISTTCAEKKELHVFSDASEKAIAACAYLITRSPEQSHIGFVLGKTKVAPKCGHTIPRLELCAAVLAVELWETIAAEIEIEFDDVHFHSDSKIVLGYIHNQKRRFYMYVGNRVERICRSTKPEQWSYVRTELNPADCATRPSTDAHHKLKGWLEGPQHLKENPDDSTKSIFPLINVEKDREIRPIVNVMNTNVTVSSGIGTQRFMRFSSWRSLVNAISLLKRVCRSKVIESSKENLELTQTQEHCEAERFIIRAVQQEAFSDEMTNIRSNNNLSKSSHLSSLSPILDKNGLLRVGGRLDNSELDYEEKHPIIMPKNHHVSLLIVRHYHEEVAHQGRHFTEGAVRSAGFWIVGCRRLVNSVIHQCVKCRKLRGKVEIQKMADLPPDRLRPCPPFTYVGVDVFGPWHVVARRTRGGVANSKYWAVLFTCLTCRAIHIEVINEMSSSSFINAVRRFVSIRGNVKEFRSDRGSNFVGSVDNLNVQAINVEDGQVNQYLNSKKCVWVFNPPHSSHMGGVWERMIGVTRRILEAMMAEPEAKHLTHEVLSTLMSEVCAIVNARPLVAVSADPEDPEVLSPATILTHKSSAVEPLVNVDPKLSYKSQWNFVQAMADKFWTRWRKEYLQNLQNRVKWCSETPNVKVNDVVLLKDKSVCRNDWPVGVVEQALSSSDGLVRKAIVRIMRDGKSLTYTRPISELVVLCSDL